MKHSTGKPTKAEVARFVLLRELGCICCRLSDAMGICLGEIEVHHLLSGNRRRGHLFTIPLCTWHHRGIHYEGRAWASRYMGPSLAYGSKPFHAVYGADDDLLLEVDTRIGAERIAA